MTSMYLVLTPVSVSIIWRLRRPSKYIGDMWTYRNNWGYQTTGYLLKKSPVTKFNSYHCKSPPRLFAQSSHLIFHLLAVSPFTTPKNPWFYPSFVPASSSTISTKVIRISAIPSPAPRRKVIARELTCIATLPISPYTTPLGSLWRFAGALGVLSYTDFQRSQTVKNSCSTSDPSMLLKKELRFMLFVWFHPGMCLLISPV